MSRRCTPTFSQRGYKASLAILGSLVPGRDPVRVAEEFATLDNLTQGRTVIGLLRGNPIEQVTFGINPEESRERFEEAVSLMLNAWQVPVPSGWEGRYFRQRTLAVWPHLVKPLSSEKVVVSGNTPASVDFAARVRLSIALGHLAVDDAAALVRRYREQARVHGWTPTAQNIVYHADPVNRVLRFEAQIRDAQARIDFGVLNGIFQINRLPDGLVCDHWSFLARRSCRVYRCGCSKAWCPARRPLRGCCTSAPRSSSMAARWCKASCR